MQDESIWKKKRWYFQQQLERKWNQHRSATDVVVNSDIRPNLFLRFVYLRSQLLPPCCVGVSGWPPARCPSSQVATAQTPETLGWGCASPSPGGKHNRHCRVYYSPNKWICLNVNLLYSLGHWDFVSMKSINTICLFNLISICQFH